MTEKEKKLEQFDNDTLRQYELRKRAIEIELNNLESTFSNGTSSSLKTWKNSILSRFLPAERIRQDPLRSVGIAVIAGLVIGGLPALLKKRKRQDRSDQGAYVHREERKRERKQNRPAVAYENPKVSSLMFNELKRSLARRGAHIMMDFVDESLERRRKNQEAVSQEYFTQDQSKEMD